MIDTNNKYIPDFVSPPGETLFEKLDELGMSQADLAGRTGLTRKTINEIVKAKEKISIDTAIKLEKVLSIPAGFWINRENNYQEFLARRKEMESFKESEEWLKKHIPYKELERRGWVYTGSTMAEKTAAALNFFGVASVKQWNEIYGENGKLQVAYRQSKLQNMNTGAISAWLRYGEIKGQETQCAQYNPQVFRKALHEIRALTGKNMDEALAEAKKLCAKSGVVFLFVKEFKGTGISGASRWLNSEKALIQLSLRYKTDDQLWFSFFHEACHLLKHTKTTIFLEKQLGYSTSDSDQEREANEFAAGFLIPISEYVAFIRNKKYFSKKEVSGFAGKIGVSPGIVVGRLQHDKKLLYSNMNDLKTRLAWAG